MFSLSVAALTLAILTSPNAFSQGFEKSGVWGARNSALGGIGVTLTGSDSLYHNPAGLVTAKPMSQLSSHLSPMAGQAKAPINNQNDIETSKFAITPSGALTYSQTFGQKWAIGVGAYGVGGSGMKFENIQFPDYVGGPVTTNTELLIAEAALGVGYKPNKNFSIGAALRYTYYMSNITMASRVYNGIALGVPEFKDLKGADTKGYKIGLQYEFNKDHKLGVSYRSESAAILEGKMTGGKALTPLTSQDIGTGDAQLKVVLPQSVTLGTSHNLNLKWTMYWEYAWLQYSKMSEFALSSTNPLVGNQSVRLNWRDAHVARLGCEYKSFMPVRFGFNYATQVTDTSLAGPGMPPAPLYGASVGTGYAGKTWAFDVALDYAYSNGVGGMAAAGDITSDARYGAYSFWMMGLHTTLRWDF